MRMHARLSLVCARRACHTAEHSSEQRRRMHTRLGSRRSTGLSKTLDETGASPLQTAIFTLPGGGGNV